jgi:pimeloyl-ACP methyl ester carboxylesterase
MSPQIPDGNPLKNLAKSVQKITDTGTQAAEQLGKQIEDVKDKVSGGVSDTKDAFEERGVGSAARSADVGRPPEVHADIWLQRARQRCSEGFLGLLRQVVNERLAPFGEWTGKTLNQLKEQVVDNLKTTEPLWAELGQLKDAIPSLPAILPQPELPFDNLAHDGKTYVVFDKNGDGQITPDEIEERQPGADEDVIYYTNGINTSRSKGLEHAQALSQQTGKPVVLTYNATTNFGLDIFQTALDKADPFGLIHPNPATDTQAEQMYQAALGDEQVEFVGYSQGGVITRNALMRAHTRLYTERFQEVLRETGNPIEAHQRASQFADQRIQNVHLTNAGAAAWAYPPYANVDFISNTQDIVPNLLGVGVLMDPRETVREVFGLDFEWLPTNDRLDVVHERGEGPPVGGHDFLAVYVDDVAKHLNA